MQTQKPNLNKVGIIAGEEGLPINLINELIKKKREFVVVVLSENLGDQIKNLNFVHISIGMVGKIIDYLRSNQVSEVVLAGSIKKPAFKDLIVDKMGAKLIGLITKNKFFGDNKILDTIVNFLENQGFIVKGAHEYIDNLLIQEKGCLTNLKPTKRDLDDIILGMKIAKNIGELDIGQAVIIENKIVLGLEAIEGTKALIERCGYLKLSKEKSGVLVKAKKPNQEERVDLPTIGLETVKQISSSNFAGIAIEAESVIVLNINEVTKLANQLKIFISVV